jgi:hypothetical protein
MSTALCNPNVPEWANATSAGVRPVDTFFTDRELPVQHRSPGTYTIRAADFDDGIILIATGHDPVGIPAVLPAIVTGASEVSVSLDPANLLDYPAGVAVVFV